MDDAAFYKYAEIARESYVHPAVERFLADNPSPPQPVIFATFSTVAAACFQIHKDDPPQAAMHAELARRRVYVHPVRWTSLGLSLLEAMHLGLPVVALATTEVVEAVPADAGVLSTRPERLWAAVREFIHDEDAARLAGKAARAAALDRYGLDRFLRDWDALLEEVTR